MAKIKVVKNDEVREIPESMEKLYLTQGWKKADKNSSKNTDLDKEVKRLEEENARLEKELELANAKIAELTKEEVSTGDTDSKEEKADKKVK